MVYLSGLGYVGRGLFLADDIGFSREKWNVEYEFYQDIRGKALYCRQALLGKSPPVSQLLYECLMI